jgi:putative NADH-flavin reductase
MQAKPPSEWPDEQHRRRTLKLAIFGATGALGRHCTEQSLAAGHDVVVLARTPSKLEPELRGRVEIVEGDGLDADAVARTLAGGVEAVLFAIGVDRGSPEGLCAEVTRHIIAGMRAPDGPRRLVWCGGGSTLMPADQIGFGARFVELFARTFMGLRQRDKHMQIELLEDSRDVEWIGVRPLQMRGNERMGTYRLGYDSFSGFSRISFADCAHAMIRMLDDDRWLHEAPIVQY